jgi:YhhN family
MYSASISPAQQAWMIGLLATWFGLLAGGFLLGNPSRPSDRRMPRWTRIGSSATLVVASWSWVCIAVRTEASAFAVLIATGMTLGFVGDLTMAHLLPASKHVLAGMVAFGLGHVAYILAFACFASIRPVASPGLCVSAWGAWVIVGAAGWWLIVPRSSPPSLLGWAALPYALLISSTAGFSTCLAMQDASFIPAAIGGALFLLSDTILAAVLFKRSRFRLVHDFVWLTYGPAQMLIVYSVSAAIQAVT